MKQKIALITFILIFGSSLMSMRDIQVNINKISTFMRKSIEIRAEKSNQEISFPLEECTGVPFQRRELAALGTQVTDQEWLQMKNCTKRREESLSGVYALHVSKSGGR